MIKHLYLFILLVCLNACHKSERFPAAYYDCNFNFADSSALHPDNNNRQTFLDNMARSGVVGISMAVYHTQTGMWLGAGGKADLYNNILMKPCNILRVGSTVKMFTAASVLKLQEEGKIHLDNKISLYLEGDFIQKIENADKATIRQLLQHSSGIYNYIQNPQFQLASINDFIREWKPRDLLKFAYHKKAYFPVGQDVKYSNTGYILLGMLIEKIEGKPFYKVFEEKLFQPLGLTMTLFAAENHVPPGIARGYIDMYSKFQVTESTYFSGWDYYTADGGLISNPYDLNKFFSAMMQGRVINAASLNEMLQWKTPSEPDTDYFPLQFGLGIFKIETPGGTAYTHSGDAVGYYANMLYFPADSTIITYAANSNYGKIDKLVSSREAIGKIIEAIK